MIIPSQNTQKSIEYTRTFQQSSLIRLGVQKHKRQSLSLHKLHHPQPHQTSMQDPEYPLKPKQIQLSQQANHNALKPNERVLRNKGIMPLKEKHHLIPSKFAISLQTIVISNAFSSGKIKKNQVKNSRAQTKNIFRSKTLNKIKPKADKNPQKYGLFPPKPQNNLNNLSYSLTNSQISLQKCIISDYQLLKIDRKMGMQIFLLKINNQEESRKRQNVRIWATFPNQKLFNNLGM